MFPTEVGSELRDLVIAPGNDGSIDAVGFGEDAERLGKVSDLAGIDDGDEVSGIEQIGDE